METTGSNTMASTTAFKIQDDKFSSLGLKKMVVNNEQVSCYSRSLGTASDNPILVLIHGYPQSAYEWRHIIPLLPANAPIFVPDLPGYGGSAAIEKNDKLNVGNVLMDALKTEVKRTSSASSSSNIPIVLIGHDRGARISQHLTASGIEGFDLIGLCLIDIVPISTQWQHNAAPVLAAKINTGTFHWPFLANVSLATRMIKAFGGANWCQELIIRWAGDNPKGLESLKSDNALSVYGGFFEREETVKATCQDYEEGATTDVEREQQNQKEGKKINVPLLLIYSKSYLGSRYDFPDAWKDWVQEGVAIKCHGLDDGIGHFSLEEAPEESAKFINEWLGGLRP